MISWKGILVLKFFEEVLDAMKLAHLNIEQTKFIHYRNDLLESSYRHLGHHNKELQERLNEYETVETLILIGWKIQLAW